ncbi:methylated-DNA--[protein]-cysteine S-methyltransferase [Erysipelotrichaceae bacterium 51-3]
MKSIRFNSPIGTIQASCNDQKTLLTNITVLKTPQEPLHSDIAILNLAKEQILEYFAKTRTIIDLPLDQTGTDFQKQVWKAVQSIPYGQTRSYGEVAAMVGRPGAARGVGSAMRANRFLLAIPCHRVIGANGKLGNYSGGQGVLTKMALINLEKEEAKQ